VSAPGRREALREGLAAAAEEMGEVLARAAFSPNIKERRDHSCAVFDPDGRLVAQAEHIPVHLGAMPRAVRAILDHVGPLEPDQAALSNDPAHGGTHLPDLTLVAPVHQAGERVACVAARAHHADVGGDAPGSMPAEATCLEQEGLVLEPAIARDGDGWREPADRLLDATRAPRERGGDLAAQAGALRVGAERVADRAAREGHDRFRAGLDAIVDHARRLAAARLDEAPAGTYGATQALETRTGEARLAVEASLGEGRLVLDYGGTDPQVDGNLNAPLPVTVAGAAFVARVLLGADVPANHGLLDRLEVQAPRGTLVNPEPGAAVAGGNVETSQRNVDLLFEALAGAFEQVPAQSQGTMNNVTIGGGEAGFAYYETLGGGEGATPQRRGRSGVHTHMTNTRNTPVEALEHALPLRVEATTLRRGTGGAGTHAGGDGLERRLTALEDGVEVNLLATRRRTRPDGRAGGQPGAPGADRVVRADGTVDEVDGLARVELDAGDTLVVATPGGGGYGRPPDA